MHIKHLEKYETAFCSMKSYVNIWNGSAQYKFKYGYMESSCDLRICMPTFEPIFQHMSSHAVI